MTALPDSTPDLVDLAHQHVAIFARADVQDVELAKHLLPRSWQRGPFKASDLARGDRVAIHSRGCVRSAIISKVGRTNVSAIYVTPGGRKHVTTKTVKASEVLAADVPADRGPQGPDPSAMPDRVYAINPDGTLGERLDDNQRQEEPVTTEPTAASTKAQMAAAAADDGPTVADVDKATAAAKPKPKAKPKAKAATMTKTTPKPKAKPSANPKAKATGKAVAKAPRERAAVGVCPGTGQQASKPMGTRAVPKSKQRYTKAENGPWGECPVCGHAKPLTPEGAVVRHRITVAKADALGTKVLPKRQAAAKPAAKAPAKAKAKTPAKAPAATTAAQDKAATAQAARAAAAVRTATAGPVKRAGKAPAAKPRKVIGA